MNAPRSAQESLNLDALSEEDFFAVVKRLDALRAENARLREALGNVLRVAMWNGQKDYTLAMMTGRPLMLALNAARAALAKGAV